MTDRLSFEDFDAGEPEDPNVRDELFDRYRAEGHLVIGYDVTRVRTAESWFGVCTCGAASWGDDELEERRIARGRIPSRLLDHFDVKVWAGGHRVDEGLDWQTWLPWRDWWPWASTPEATG